MMIFGDVKDNPSFMDTSQNFTVTQEVFFFFTFRFFFDNTLSVFRFVSVFNLVSVFLKSVMFQVPEIYPKHFKLLEERLQGSRTIHLK